MGRSPPVSTGGKTFSTTLPPDSLQPFSKASASSRPKTLSNPMATTFLYPRVLQAYTPKGRVIWAPANEERKM